MLGDIDLTKKVIVPQLTLCKPDKTEIAKLKHLTTLPQRKLNLGNVNELNFTLPFYVDINHEYTRYKPIDLIRHRYLIKFVLGTYTEYFLIDKLDDQGDGNQKTKSVHAYSLSYQLRDKYIRDYKVASYNLTQLTNDALSITNWSIGYVDPTFNSKYRQMDVSSQTVLAFLQDCASTFDALIDFDTVNKQVNFYNLDSYGNNEGLLINYGKYLKQINNTIDTSNVFTRIVPTSNNDLSIRGVNPTGQDYIDDFTPYIYPYATDNNGNVTAHSYYMSDGLCQAILDYNKLVDDNKTTFSDLLSQQSSIQTTLTSQQNDMNALNTDMATIQDNLDIAKSMSNDTTTLNQQKADKQSEIDAKQTDIDDTQSQLDSVNSQIANLSNTLDVNNNFTTEQLDELNNFVFEYEWTDTNYIDAQELYNDAITNLQKLNSPPTVIDIDIVNFLEVVESQRDWNKLNLGDYVTIKYDEFGIKTTAQIISIDQDFGNKSIKLTIANIKEVKNEQQKVLDQLYSNTVSAIAVDLNKHKWDMSTDNKTAIDDIRNNAFDATKQEILAGVNESVSISSRGMVIKNSNDPMKMLIAQNSVIALSGDGGDTWRTAIHPDGIYGDVIIGQILVGENLLIQNTSGKFTFDKDGATIDGASLTITKSGNGIGLDPTSGITVTRSDNKIKTVLNATDGIKIQKSTDNGLTWIDQFYVDTDGNVNANELIITSNYNGVNIDSKNGITVVKSDNLVQSIMNATSGFKIQNRTSPTDTWNDAFYVDTNGKLTTNGISVENGSISGSTFTSTVSGSSDKMTLDSGEIVFNAYNFNPNDGGFVTSADGTLTMSPTYFSQTITPSSTNNTGFDVDYQFSFAPGKFWIEANRKNYSYSGGIVLDATVTIPTIRADHSDLITNNKKVIQIQDVTQITMDIDTTNQPNEWVNANGDGYLKTDIVVPNLGIYTNTTNLYLGADTTGEIRATDKNLYNGGSITYVPVRASGFPTGSLASTKTDIKEWNIDILSRYRNDITVYDYMLKREVNLGIYRRRQGLVIGNGYNIPPELIDGDGTEQYLINSWNVKAIQALIKEIDDLKAEMELMKNGV